MDNTVDTFSNLWM